MPLPLSQVIGRRVEAGGANTVLAMGVPDQTESTFTSR